MTAGGTATADATATLPRVARLMERWIDRGSCLGGQVFVWRAGDVVADFAIGRSGPDRPAQPTDVGRLYCAVKPLGAICVARAVEMGEVDLNDPLARFLPSFRDGRRASVTVRRLLSQSSGLPNFLAGGDVYSVGYREGVDIACDAPIEERAWYAHPVYNATHAWHVVAALVERLFDRPYPDVVRSVIGAPLGRPTLTLTEPHPDLFSEYYLAEGDGSYDVLGDVPHRTLFTRVNPAHGGFASARDMGELYVELLRCLSGDGALLGPATVRELISHQATVDLGARFGHRRYGLGFMLDVRDDACEGDWGPTSFGHCGTVPHYRVINSFADPEHDVVASLRLFSVDYRNNWRFAKLGGALFNDLGGS